MLVSELNTSIEAREENDNKKAQISDDAASKKMADSKQESGVLSEEEKMELLSRDKCAEASHCCSSSNVKQDDNVVPKDECVVDKTGSEAADKVAARTCKSTSEVLECAIGGDNNVVKGLDKTIETVGEDKMDLATTSAVCELGAKRIKHDNPTCTLSTVSTQGTDTLMTKSAQGKDTVIGSEEPQTVSSECNNHSSTTYKPITSDCDPTALLDSNFQQNSEEIELTKGDGDAAVSAQNSTNSCNDSEHLERTSQDGDKDVPTSSTDGTANQNPETRDCSTCLDAVEEERLNRLARELCRECQQPLPDPEPESMMLYLHALTYKVNVMR